MPISTLFPAAAVALCVSIASAQTITPTARTGTTFAGCGDVFTGPRITHNFSSPVNTHDPISVSDSGQGGLIPISSAASTLDATQTPTTIAISVSGDSMRGSPAQNGNTSALANSSASDQWSFNVSQTTCFTLDISVDCFVSTGDATVGQGVQFGRDGTGDIALSDGTHPGVIGASVSTTGSIAHHYSGTIAAGSYFISGSGQATGNGSPRTATFNHSITLRIGADAADPPATVSPAVTSACSAQATPFSVPAVNGATYQWQIETSPGVWQGLGNDPAPLPCGSGAFAYASPINSPSVNIGVHPCAGGSSAYRVRCIVTTGCAATPTNPATLFIDAADIGQSGGAPGRDGRHDNNDFIAFINAFFNQQPAADLGSQGGVLGADGRFDNNDFIAFINLFFAAC
ncbi:MAG: GC-type dockerin domain-anchored protein [Phycisphaerales bacterium]